MTKRVINNNPYCKELDRLIIFFGDVTKHHNYDKNAYREHVFVNTNLLGANYYYFKILKEYKEKCGMM